MKRNRAARILATLLVASGCAAAQAATYYFSNCDAGAAPGCQAGDDTVLVNSASAPWRSIAKLNSTISNLNAGDKILLAKGGAWITTAGISFNNPSATAANPITLDSYAPAWLTADVRPKLIAGVPDLLEFISGSPDPDGGYVLQNLDLRGGSAGDRGAIVWNGSNMTLQNVNIEGFRLGIECASAAPGFRLLNSTIRNNRAQGVLTNCSNSVIEGNTFDGNGYAARWLDHSLYINADASQGPTNNVVVRGNTLINNSVNPAVANSKCIGAAMVAHGRINNLLIENNLVQQASGTAEDVCWGIAVDAGYPSDQFAYAETFTGVVIRGNTVVNTGNLGIGCQACVSPLIENNVVVMESQQATAIAVPDRQHSAEDTQDTGATIRNNSIYFSNTQADSTGIALAWTNGVTLNHAGSNLKVVSNLIHFGGANNNPHVCFDLTGLSPSNFTKLDNNLCHHAGTNGRYSHQHANLAAAQAPGLDYDDAGTDQAPVFVATPSASNGWSLAQTSTSPAVNAGHASLSAPTDKGGTSRNPPPDMGAYEYQSSSCTSGPAWVRIANEYRTFTVPSTNTVRFGNVSGWVYKPITASASCTTGTFNGTPPSGTRWCELENTWTTATRIAIGQDYQTFTIPTAQTVFYGNANGWTQKALAAGTYGCGAATFNNVTPGAGAKRCEIVVQPASCLP